MASISARVWRGPKRSAVSAMPNAATPMIAALILN
jgi:hypothetical protein